MSTRNKIFTSVLALLVLAVLLVYAFRVDVSRMLYNSALNALIETSSDSLEDGLHIYVCGAGSPLPDPKRGGTCIAVLAGDHAFIFDAGSGGSRTLSQMRFPWAKVQRVFITHYHSDHIDGLGEIMLQNWVAGQRTEPLPISGPPGIKTIVGGFVAAYELDRDYRVDHHGEQLVNSSGFGARAIEFDLAESPISVYQSDGVKITAFEVNHEPVLPAVGYKIEYGGRTVVISGDTIFHENVLAASNQVDVLLHEALNPEMISALSDVLKKQGADNLSQLMADTLSYHTSPVEAAQLAQQAEARELVLYHIAPPLQISFLNILFLDGVSDAYDGKVTIAEDGLLISLPAGSEQIRHSYLL